LYYADGRVQTDGKKMTTIDATWVNVDNSIGIVTLGGTGHMAFGEQTNNNSILCSKLYPMYSTIPEKFIKDRVMEHAAVVYYSQVDSTTTAQLAAQAVSLNEQLPEGWSGIIVSDPDGERNLLVANLAGGSKNKAELKELTFKELGAPVLRSETFITDSKGTATIALDENHAYLQPLTVFVQGTGVAAKMFNQNDELQLYIRTLNRQGKEEKVVVTMMVNGKPVSKTIDVYGTTLIRLDENDITYYVEEEEPSYYKDITAQVLVNPNFEEDDTWGTTGSITLNGTTYNPCYTQSVKAANSNFPQVLPVKGWTSESKLSPASKFALLYSMPYSFSQYCVSPSNVGNSTSIMAVPAQFEEEVGSRCLSILNSWTSGTNAISQEVKLPTSGHYRLTFDMRYDCANESRRTAPNVITTTGGNVNTALCGVSFQGEELYAPYPVAAGTWEERVIDFDYPIFPNGDMNQTITLRLGLNTTANQGAANNTRLYIDNVRLWQQISDQPDGVLEMKSERSAGALYDLSGRPVGNRSIKSGLYIRNNQKVILP
jgi:hypothetical protein